MEAPPRKRALALDPLSSWPRSPRFFRRPPRRTSRSGRRSAPGDLVLDRPAARPLAAALARGGGPQARRQPLPAGPGGLRRSFGAAPRCSPRLRRDEPSFVSRLRRVLRRTRNAALLRPPGARLDDARQPVGLDLLGPVRGTPARERGRRREPHHPRGAAHTGPRGESAGRARDHGAGRGAVWALRTVALSPRDRAAERLGLGGVDGLAL